MSQAPEGFIHLDLLCCSDAPRPTGASRRAAQGIVLLPGGGGTLPQPWDHWGKKAGVNSPHGGRQAITELGSGKRGCGL